MGPSDSFLVFNRGWTTREVSGTVRCVRRRIPTHRGGSIHCVGLFVGVVEQKIQFRVSTVFKVCFKSGEEKVFQVFQRRRLGTLVSYNTSSTDVSHNKTEFLWFSGSDI